MYKNGYGIEQPTMVDMPSNQTKPNYKENYSVVWNTILPQDHDNETLSCEFLSYFTSYILR